MVDEIKNTKIGGNDLTEEGITPAKWNLTFDAVAWYISQIYTSTGFNSSASATSDEQSYEFTAITAAGLSGSTYLKIRIVGIAQIDAVSGVQSKVELKIQTKNVGGSYADTLAYVTVAEQTPEDTSAGQTLSVPVNLEWIHTLSGSELSAGSQVKVFSKSTSNNGSDTASFTNIQTVIEVL